MICRSLTAHVTGLDGFSGTNVSMYYNDDLPSDKSGLWARQRHALTDETGKALNLDEML